MRRVIAFLWTLSTLTACARAAALPAPIPPPTPPTMRRPAFDPIARAHATLTIPSDAYAPIMGFPAQPQTVPCALPMYTPPQADGSSGGTAIAATCTTSVQGYADSWIVSFTQTWDPHDFRAVQDAGRGPFQHTWEVTLDQTGVVQSRRHFGHFPPQYVHTPFADRPPPAR